MKLHLHGIFFLIIFYPCFLTGQSIHSEGLIAWWSFDSIENKCLAIEEISGKRNPIINFFESTQGVQGKAIKLDGYHSRIESRPLPLNGNSELYMEAWVALQSYPWNKSPIINQGKPSFNSQTARHSSDIFFGFDAFGHLVFELKLGDSGYYCRSSEAVVLLNWNHVAASFNSKNGMQLYINGEKVAYLKTDGIIGPLSGTDLWLGMNLEKIGPLGSERQASADIPSRMVVHGLMDEIKIYDRAPGEKQIRDFFELRKPGNIKALSWQLLPAGPDSLAPDFNAHYTRLLYTDEWEAQQNVGDFSDILVHFDQMPVRYLFWRGTGYGGVWVTENGIWMGDQSLERANKGKSPMGCAEHMSDKQNRYSHVRIIENNDARIVIHWRYAIADILYDIFGINEANPSGEWADEYYYIYPDGATVRHQVLWSSYLSHEWQETIVINQPGTSPDDNIELEAITLLNMRGESKTYSWEGGGPASFPEPEHANIQIVNLKSTYRPYIIFEPNPEIRPFSPGAIRPEYAHFPWWNHWPVAQIPNDGRRAFGPDRPSHSSLSQSIEGSDVIHENQDGSFEVMSLTGMTDQPATSLVPLARSWNNAPRLISYGNDVKKSIYLKRERAYLITLGNSPIVDLSFAIHASEEAPLVHPAFVIEHWGEGEPVLMIDGKILKAGTDFRYGYRKTPRGTDLIIWINISAVSSTKFTIVYSSPMQ